MSRGGSSWLFVTNLPPGSSQDDFTLLFSQSGCVSSRLTTDRQSGRSVGYLEFPDASSAMAARNFYAGFQVDGSGGVGLALETVGGFPDGDVAGVSDPNRSSGSKRPRVEYERADPYVEHVPYDPESSGSGYNPPQQQQQQQQMPTPQQPSYQQSQYQNQPNVPQQHAQPQYANGVPQQQQQPPRWQPPGGNDPPPLPSGMMPRHQQHRQGNMGAPMTNPHPQNQMPPQNVQSRPPMMMPLPGPTRGPLPGPGPPPRAPQYGAPPGPAHAPQPVYGAPPPMASGPPMAMGAMGGPPRGLIRKPLPHDASATIYVEGVPADATVREMAHVFRPFEGFKSTRLVSKESVRGPLCFAEFDNPEFALTAKDTLQGYLIDRDDPESSSLRISFAKSQGHKPGAMGANTKGARRAGVGRTSGKR